MFYLRSPKFFSNFYISFILIKKLIPLNQTNKIYVFESEEVKMDYKRTVREPDGKHIIIYQDNGWIQHIKIYNNGDRDEWLEEDHA